MKRLLLFLLLLPAAGFAADRTTLNMTRQWSSYFSNEVRAIESRGLSEVRTLEEWTGQREERRQQLLEMLGLWPLPERTPLEPVITGKLEHELFTVEKLHFQASPHLYVTANLYVPRSRPGKLPAILYVCGHSSGVTNGISCGNKTGYQRHGAWFARNGYVCLTIDTLQLGEIRGTHHGTHSDGQWRWNSRGYTPAGVEAWFGMRALDYLCSRPEVDAERIGMTGRSGGGAYSWTVAAIDERVKVAAPIAGMTDLHNQVIDGVVDGHCDCMFHINTYRWDFPIIGALIAPRPLLLGNSDKDRIFPLEGVLRTHEQIRRIYSLYNQNQNLGLLITEGEHKDTQELQVPVFRWFNRFLKNDQPLIEMAAVPFFSPEQLRVFDALPQDERNTTAPEWFNRTAPRFKEKDTDVAGLRAALQKGPFSGWPEGGVEGRAVLVSTVEQEGVLMRTYDLPIQTGITQRLYHLLIRAAQKPSTLTIFVPGTDEETALLGLLANGKPQEAAEELRRLLPNAGNQIAVFVPRGVGDELFAKTELATRMRRRFMLLGQTLDGMRVWDIRCAIAALRKLPGLDGTRLSLSASGPMAVNAAFAALYEPVEDLQLSNVPTEMKERPDYLQMFRVLESNP